MSDEIAKTSVDPTQIPEAAHKFAQRALREHQRAEKDVMKAVEHVVKSGQALLKAYDLCEYGQWNGFFEMHFKNKTSPDDDTQPLTMRTAQRYMQLARDWSQLIAQHPDGFSSQRQAFKALAAIARTQENPQSKAIDSKGAARCASGETTGDATALIPALSEREQGKKRRRTGPVWRASGPFVSEALRLVRSINESLTKLIGQGYPFGEETENVRAALVRLQQMIDTDLDECEAQQARGEIIWVMERPARGRGRRDGKRGES